MSRSSSRRLECTARFPRAGGDVPSRRSRPTEQHRFSPCRRGCPEDVETRTSQMGVFPVQAGMSRFHSPKNLRPPCFPRAGGDVPAAVQGIVGGMVFSPCRRGCPATAPARKMRNIVFPVQAGMSRTQTARTSRRRRFPRAGGDVPRPVITYSSLEEFSPCRRGCPDY